MIRWKLKRSEYLKLNGLLHLAHKYSAILRDIEEEMCRITGEDPQEGGHTGDAIYSDYTVDQLLRKLKAQAARTK